MRYWLLCLILLPCRMATAQSAPTRSPLSLPVLPPLPEASLQTAVSTTTVSNKPGVRYQYQLVHLEEDGYRIWLAPAWQGKTKLETTRKAWNKDQAGELDGLLMQTLNELAADGWELIEIRTVAQPAQAVQKVERDLVLNDPERPRYTGTTSIQTDLQMRYLFRKALP